MADSAGFLELFLSPYECWVHHLDQEQEITHAPKEANAISSAEKLMASVFKGCKSHYVYCLSSKGAQINGEYYGNLLRLSEIRRPGKLRKVVMFQQDNAQVHRSLVSMAVVYK